MKRILSGLLALLMLLACTPVCADTYTWDYFAIRWGGWFSVNGEAGSDYPEIQQTLRDAGRLFYAHEAYVYDHTKTLLLTVIELDDCAQLTILRKAEDGQWTVEAGNDTVPFRQFNRISAGWALDEAIGNPIPRDERYGFYYLDSDRAYDGHYAVELDSLSAVKPDQMGNCLRIYLYSDENGWYVQNLHLNLYEQDADECEGKYYRLFQIENGDWKYEYYAIIDYGNGLERTKAPLFTAVLEKDETMARMRMDTFDYPALISYLNGLLPEDLPDAHTVPGALSGSREEDTEQAAAARGNNDEPAQPAAQEPSEKPDFVYYNPNGGRYYHAGEECDSVSPQYLPLTAIPFDHINDAEFASLIPCPFCRPVVGR